MSYAMYVGWDWADSEHELSERDVSTNVVTRRTVEGTPEAIHGWAEALLVRYGGKQVAICIEGSRGAVIFALMRYPHIVIFPVNPKSAALFREALNPSGKKDDPVDAESLREMVEKHREKLRPMRPDDPETRSLGILGECRRKVVHDIVRETHRLRANLKSYFPQALELAGDLDTPMACDFLKRWPTLESLHRAQPQSISKFYREHNSRSTELIEKRLCRIKQAVALTDDEALLTCGSLQTRILIGIIRELMKAFFFIDSAI